MPKDSSNTPTLLIPNQVAFIIDSAKPVLTHAREIKTEATIGPHSHPRGQLLWAEKGVLRVTSNESVWIVPETHAIWIPSEISHQVDSETYIQLRNLYIDPSYSIRKDEQSIVMVTMSALMREVILTLSDASDHLTEQRIKHLGLVAIDELQVLKPFNNYIHAGKDPRLQRLISYMVKYPHNTLSLPVLATKAGASVRTIERLFKSETGMTFRQWRSRFRLMNSLVQLTHDKSTTNLAHELGYKSVSSFISTFKSQFGCTPQQYIAQS
jgi:AraC-like DNA-binding protein